MKKILCILLSAALLSSLFTAVSFAEDGDILNRDFEDGSVSGINKSATVSIVDEAAEDGGKCLSFGTSGDIARFMFPTDTVTSSGILCVEFDIKEGFGGIGMGVFTSADTNYGNYQKAPFSSGTKNSSPARGLKAYTTPGAKQHPSGNAGSETYIKGYRAKDATADMAIEANKWQHVLLELDLDKACSYLTLDGVKSEAVEGFTYLSDIVGIGFKWAPAGLSAGSSGDLCEAYIDNLRVYTMPPYVSEIKIKDADGNVLTGEKILPSAQSINVEFTAKIESEPNIKLERGGEEEPVKTEWDLLRRSISITPEKGYFESLSSYVLTIESGYSDSYGNVCGTDYTFEFETDEGGITLSGLHLQKDGNDVNLSEVSGGDTLSVCAKYILTHADKKIENAVLAVVFENDGRLMHIAKKTVNLDEFGTKTAQFEVQIPTETEFDSAYVYLWDLNSRVPLTSFADYAK